MRFRDYILCAAVLLATCISTSAAPFIIPSGSAPTTDFFGEIEADNNAWAASRGALQFFDGTANTYLLGALVSDAPTNGQVPKWNTGGTITWEDDTSGGASLTPTDLAGGTTLAVGNAYFDTVSANRTFAALPAGSNGDEITLTFDVTGATRTLDFHTSSTVYRLGTSGAIAAALSFPVGNHGLRLTKTDGKWWLTDTGVDIETANYVYGSDGSGVVGFAALTAAQLPAAAIVSTEIDTSAEIAAIVGDETGSGALVFGTSPQISAIEVGHATDTTLSRSSSGVLRVESDTILMSGAYQDVSNKQITSGSFFGNGSTAGGVIKIFEDTDLGANFASIAIVTRVP
jgi:hypothetical protein